MSAEHAASIPRRPNPRAWLELTRLSNIPTVWTNVLVGAAAGGTVSGWIAWRGPVVAGVVTTLLYAAGMTLNDLFDAERDARARPERPIPSGRISRTAALTFVIACAAASLALSLTLGLPGIVLTGLLILSIVLYDWLHGARAPAGLFMGVNRALVYILAGASVAGFEALADSPLLWLAGAAGLYTLLLTLIARTEASSGPSPIATLAWTLPIIPLVTLMTIRPERPVLLIPPAMLMLAWIARGAASATASPARTKHAVLSWLSGFCLIDAFYLALLNRPALLAIALACFALTVLAHRRILGT